MTRGDGKNRRLIEFETKDDADPIRCVSCGDEYHPGECGYANGRCPDCRGHKSNTDQ